MCSSSFASIKNCDILLLMLLLIIPCHITQKSSVAPEREMINPHGSVKSTSNEASAVQSVIDTPATFALPILKLVCFLGLSSPITHSGGYCSTINKCPRCLPLYTHLLTFTLTIISAALLGARFRDSSSTVLGCEDGDIGADEFPPASVMGRRRSRAVLYQLSGHYKPEKVKTKLKINNVSVCVGVEGLPRREITMFRGEGRI